MDDVTKDLTGKIIDPALLVDYQTGSVVSRMITYKKEGTITLFAFDADSGLSEHSAPYDAIIEIIEGTAEITLNSEKFTIGAHQMIILPANIPHAVYAACRFKMMLTMIHAE